MSRHLYGAIFYNVDTNEELYKTIEARSFFEAEKLAHNLIVPAGYRFYSVIWLNRDKIDTPNTFEYLFRKALQ